MRLRSPALCAVLIASVFSLPRLALAQPQQCPSVPAPVSKEANIFNEEQEIDLGDAVAEHLQRDFRIIADDDVSAYLQSIGERLVRHIPGNKMRYRFFIIDMPMVNAFVLPGGRVYVTRKMIAAARQEDELAGVLGHEIGHSVERDAAVRMTAQLQAVLGVRSVGDRRDIFDKYHQVQENWRRKPDAMRGSARHAQKDQLAADDFGLYLMTLAGYSPRVYSGFWDRQLEVKGKTGNWFSDFFGTTRPESRRLREMLKFMEELPPACLEQRNAAASSADYPKWQSQVIAYSGLGGKESLPALLSKTILEPPIGGDLNRLKFSPDGGRILAQDNSSIYVIAREPMEVLFRIDAPEAKAAQFTPDSKFVVFHNSGLRVEKWSIADEQMVSVKEITLNRMCLQTALSPDGEYLGCVGSGPADSIGFDLMVFQVSSGAQVFLKKSFVRPNVFSLIFALLLVGASEGDNEIDIKWAEMNFSPDAKYFLVGTDTSVVGVDLATRQEMQLSGSVKKLMHFNFMFLGPNRLLGIAGEKGQKSAVVTFPTGQPVMDLNLGAANVEAPTHGEYVVLRPIDKYPVGVMDLATKKIFLASNKSAFDIFDQQFLSERSNGEVGLYSAETQRPVATVRLPRGPIGTVRAAAVTPDLRWLAISERDRGAVWNLNSGMRILHMRGFRGGYFDGKNGFYADFPKFKDIKRTMARLDLLTRQTVPGEELPDEVRQHGPFLVSVKPVKEKGGRDRNVNLVVSDVLSNQEMWKRYFPKEAPSLQVSWSNDSMVLSWSVKQSHAKDAINADPGLKARLVKLKEKDGDYYVEALDARTGAICGKMLIETGKGSFRVSRAILAGDRVVIGDSENRVLVYDLGSGDVVGRVFGNIESVSAKHALLAVENEPGQLTVYELSKLEQRAHYGFSSPISLAQFSGDGKKLFALTSSQNTYFLDVSALNAGATTASAPK